MTKTVSKEPQFNSLSDIKAVIFDYGNTLVELGPKQVKILNSALLKTLSELFGDCDIKRFTEVRKSQILAPYNTEDFIENVRNGTILEVNWMVSQLGNY